MSHQLVQQRPLRPPGLGHHPRPAPPLSAAAVAAVHPRGRKHQPAASAPAVTAVAAHACPAFSSYSELDISSGEDLGWRDDYSAHYITGRLLGSGSFGTVFQGVDLHTGKEVAIKILPKVRGKLTKEKTLEKLAREVDILERLQGFGGVIQLEDVFEDRDNVSIVTELCSGGDLQNFAEEHGPLSERSLALVAFEVLKIIKACHDAGLLHGDVKPANFCLKHQARNPLVSQEPSPRMYSSNWLKAIDFGCSQLLPGSRKLSKRTGTPVFMAPEVFSRCYYQEADMWSLGVMLYQLFARRFPFWDTIETCKASRLEEVAQAVSEARIPYDYGPWLRMSREGMQFIEGCLTRDPGSRLTVEQALRHPWLARMLAGTGLLSPVAASNNIVSKASGKAMAQLQDVPAAA